MNEAPSLSSWLKPDAEPLAKTLEGATLIGLAASLVEFQLWIADFSPLPLPLSCPSKES